MLGSSFCGLLGTWSPNGHIITQLQRCAVLSPHFGQSVQILEHNYLAYFLPKQTHLKWLSWKNGCTNSKDLIQDSCTGQAICPDGELGADPLDGFR